jgi:hypothetical protein
MVRLWSEIRGGRAKEQLADVATLAWITLWAAFAWNVYELITGFAETGRTLRAGGTTMIQSGQDLGAALAGVPFVGQSLRGVAERAFSAAGSPIVAFGVDLESLIGLVGAILALLVLLVPTLPWLTRYVPWRWERLRSMRAGHRAIRLAPAASPDALRQILAMRALTRLDYRDLLDFTPDPLGDWLAGRHDRLAQAELASVGLRP